MAVTPGCILLRAGDAVHDGPLRLLGQRSQKQAHVRKNLPENHGVPIGRCSLARPTGCGHSRLVRRRNFTPLRPPDCREGRERSARAPRCGRSPTCWSTSGRLATSSTSAGSTWSSWKRSTLRGGADNAAQVSSRSRARRRPRRIRTVRDRAKPSYPSGFRSTQRTITPIGQARLDRRTDGRTPDSERRLNPRRVSPGLV